MVTDYAAYTCAENDCDGSASVAILGLSQQDIEALSFLGGRSARWLMGFADGSQNMWNDEAADDADGVICNEYLDGWVKGRNRRTRPQTSPPG